MLLLFLWNWFRKWRVCQVASKGLARLAAAESSTFACLSSGTLDAARHTRADASTPFIGKPSRSRSSVERRP